MSARIFLPTIKLALAPILLFGICVSTACASDWDEDVPKKNSKPASKKSESIQENNSSKGGQHLEGKIEKAGEASLRLSRPVPDGTLTPQSDEGSAKGGVSEDGLKGFALDGILSPMTPRGDNSSDPLQGKATLLGGKNAKGDDPDQDDVELMVEWDRWHNRFLRAVQLGTQEMLNNPDPDDVEHLRADPRSGNFTSRYPLGIASAFSCIVTADGQIKNLETIESSGYPKYDRAVLRAVQQLAGTQILNYPRGSHRRTVIQPGRIRTATNSDFKYYHFGDVEHIRH